VYHVKFNFLSTQYVVTHPIHMVFNIIFNTISTLFRSREILHCNISVSFYRKSMTICCHCFTLCLWEHSTYSFFQSLSIIFKKMSKIVLKIILKTIWIGCVTTYCVERKLNFTWYTYLCVLQIQKKHLSVLSSLVSCNIVSCLWLHCIDCYVCNKLEKYPPPKKN
jgi:hypothetical protein